MEKKAFPGRRDDFYLRVVKRFRPRKPPLSSSDYYRDYIIIVRDRETRRSRP